VKILRVIIAILGVLMVVLGLIWIGQGSGYFPYPAESFMINQTPWIYWGLLLTALGLIVLFVSRKVRR